MKLVFLNKKEEVPGVFSFIFQPEVQITWAPGQYLHYVFNHPDADDRGTERWFTISAAPFEQHIMLTTRMTTDKGSSFKKALLQLAEGDSLEADGPKGSFILQDGDHKHILIAGGIGITPYRSMLTQLDHDNQDKEIELLYANKDDQLVFGEQLQAIAQRRQNLHITTFIDKHIELPDVQQYLDDPRSIFYLSGPEPMVENYETMLQEAGLPEERIKTDFFPGY